MKEEGIRLSLFLGGTIFGVLFMLVLYPAEKQKLYDECRKKHDVYECEWTRNPYTPVSAIALEQPED